VPFVGSLAWFAAVVVGLGAIVVAASRTRRRTDRPEDRASVPPEPATT
jgi:hypothetical protein